MKYPELQAVTYTSADAPPGSAVMVRLLVPAAIHDEKLRNKPAGRRLVFHPVHFTGPAGSERVLKKQASDWFKAEWRKGQRQRRLAERASRKAAEIGRKLKEAA